MSGQSTTVIGDQNIVGYHLVNVGNVTNHYHAERGKPHTLESCAVVDALLNSKERYHAPKCHPDTHQAALAVVKDWICRRGDEAEKDIMWMSGAPGAGKSAVVQTAGEALGADDGSRSWFSRIVFGNGYIDACYFFARGCGDREKAASFPATIAYQLARSRPSFSWSIKNAIAANPAIFEESWPSQFRHLILKPAVERWSFLGPVTIVIDGLDECDSEADQMQLLELILEAAATKKMRFFITSRPGQAIETFFAQIHASQHTCHIRLDEETFHTRRDIEVFLRAKFARIRQLKPEGCPRLPNGEDWPGSVVIRQIADDSDSQFMFPELAVDFIDLPGFSPNEQLRILLSSPILSYRPSSELRRDDNSPIDYREVIMGILQIIIAWPNGPFSPARIAELLDEKVDVVQSIIHGPMRSLFKSVSTNPDSPITLCHQSLRDYLLDRKRSRDFFISCGDADSLFSKILSQRPPSNPVQTYSPGAVMDILTALLVRGGRSSMHEVAESLYLDYNFVERAVYGPARSLFDVTTEGVWLSAPNLQSFLTDASRAGDFYIPRTDPDAVLLRIVIRQSLSRQPYSQDVWIGILAVLCVQPFPDLDISGIAFVLGIAPKVVQAAVLGPTKSLFAIGDAGEIRFSTPELPSFLSDPERAGQFYIPSNIRDTLYTSILSRPPPSNPSQTYSRDVLMGVLAVLRDWGKGLDVSEIANILNVDPDIVNNLVSRNPLFTENRGRIVFSGTAFADFLSSPERAGEYFVSGVMLDPCFTQVLLRHPEPPTALYPSRQTLLEVLAVLTAAKEDNSFCTGDIAFILNLSDLAIAGVVDGPAREIISHCSDDSFFIHDELKGFLHDIDRAGEFYIPDEAKALAEAEYSHYATIYKNVRRVLIEDADSDWDKQSISFKYRYYRWSI